MRFRPALILAGAVVLLLLAGLLPFGARPGRAAAAKRFDTHRWVMTVAGQFFGKCDRTSISASTPPVDDPIATTVLPGSKSALT